MHSFSSAQKLIICRDVRKIALAHIRVSKQTVPGIIKRLRDVQDDVRKAAITLFATKVPFTKLSSQQRCTILHELMKDKYAPYRISRD